MYIVVSGSEPALLKIGTRIRHPSCLLIYRTRFSSGRYCDQFCFGSTYLQLNTNYRKLERMEPLTWKKEGITRSVCLSLPPTICPSPPPTLYLFLPLQLSVCLSPSPLQFSVSSLPSNSLSLPPPLTPTLCFSLPSHSLSLPITLFT